jgi:hypothetical protein
MIELQNDTLSVSFPEVHPEARLQITFQRTLRIPDDDRNYPLPPSLGSFPLRHVDDFADRLPAAWRRRGGVMLPMYQSEAMWLSFHSPTRYPFAVKVAAGKRDALTGEAWKDGLTRDPQNYMPVPGQPWLDGFVVEKGTIRQFVAMPLGAGYSVEEQLTGAAEHGGVQLQVYPLRREVWEREKPRFLLSHSAVYDVVHHPVLSMAEMDMGLAAGGRMRQEVYSDRRSLEDWDRSRNSRCFVHLMNAMVWRSVTGSNPPSVPLTAKEYTDHGFPWFEYYDADREGLEAAPLLKGIKSIRGIGEEKQEPSLPENEAVDPEIIVPLSPPRYGRRVREGEI